MRPVISVLIINIGLVVVGFLIAHFIFHEIKIVMFFAGFQGLINLAACLVLMMDRKKKDNQLVYALLVGFGLMVVITLLLWFLVNNVSGPLPELEVPT